MFRHLRNRLIFINMAVSSVVLIVAFSSVYVVALNEAHRRQSVVADIVPGYTQIVIQTIHSQIQSEQKEALRTLLASLFITGLAVEAAVGVLSYALAETAIRPIKEAYEAQKSFIANASHEMKTPIAAIMANLEVADIQGNQWIDNVAHEVKYMADLNQQLLILARAENAITAAKVAESVVLKDFVEETIAPFQPRIKNQKVKFEFKTQLKTAKVKLFKNDFRQIISILMDNALKYCDHSIVLTLTSKSIGIENDGATISAENQAKVFERFYQTNKSSEGVGLGLSIAKTIADHDGWKLSVSSDKTTKFTLGF